MRIYVFLCLMCWVESGYFKFSSNSKPDAGNEGQCLEFSKLTIRDSIKDLFNPQIKVILMLYSRSNLNCGESLFMGNNSLNVNYKPWKKTVWIIHGYRPMGSTPTWLHKFRKTLLNEEDVNVIVVDWNKGATTLIYNRAVKNTRVVAETLSETIQTLMEHGTSLDKFHFIGMSLGAHISGFVGKIFRGQIGRITGLDPAGPRFAGKPSNRRLDYTDAKFVDIIHSDTKGLGIREPLGHIDFYPNGGKKQPGCPTSFFSGIEYVKCDHQRAIHLFMAALETNCKFVSFPCRSYKDYKNGLCLDCGNTTKDLCPELGNHATLWKHVLEDRMERWPLRTIAFLDTSGQYPFCIAFDDVLNFGSINFKLLKENGEFEYPKLYEKNKSHDQLQEVHILAQFLTDIKSISKIFFTYYDHVKPNCSACQYKIQSIMLKSLTYPERPPFCGYDFNLKNREEINIKPNVCRAKIFE